MSNPGNSSLVTNPGDAGSKPTGVVEELSDFGFSVTSVTPNPFFNNVSINYTLDKPVLMYIAVYNLKGAIVKNLLFQNQDKGTYKLMWDGTDNYGNRIGNGIYLINVRNNNNSITKKIIYLILWGVLSSLQNPAFSRVLN